MDARLISFGEIELDGRRFSHDVPRSRMPDAWLPQRPSAQVIVS